MGPHGPGLLPTVPTPSSHHTAAESLISLVGETGAMLEMCGGEGSGRGGRVVSTGQGPCTPLYSWGGKGWTHGRRPCSQPGPHSPRRLSARVGGGGVRK